MPSGQGSLTSTLNFIEPNMLSSNTDSKKNAFEKLPPSVPEATVIDSPQSIREAELQELKAFTLQEDVSAMGEVEKFQERLAMIKGNIPPFRLFSLGVLAGWWVGLATLLAVTATGGMPADIRKQWPLLPKLCTGFLFPVAIFFIVLFGGELFTGNAMVMCIGLASRRISFLELLYNWSFVLASNFVGCVATVYFFGYLTHLFDDDPWKSYIQGVADTKINLKPEVAFLRAITANALVCVCVCFGLSARDMLGKMMGMWFPIMAFASIGFEHAIANMAYIPLGLMYGSKSDWRMWLYQNFILCVLGNIVGGGFIVGGSQYFLFDWTNVYPKKDSASSVKPLAIKDDVKQPLPPAFNARACPPALDGGRLRRVFRNFDGDGDGALNTAELMCALHVLGFPCSKTIADGALATDGDKKGLVRYEGYTNVVRRMQDLYELGLRDCVAAHADLNATASSLTGQA